MSVPPYLFVEEMRQSQLDLVADEITVLFAAPTDQELTELDLDVDGIGHSLHNVQNRLEELGRLGLLDVQHDGLDLDDQVLELCDVPRASGNKPYWCFE